MAPRSAKVQFPTQNSQRKLIKNTREHKENLAPRSSHKKTEEKLFDITQKAREQLQKRLTMNPLLNVAAAEQVRVKEELIEETIFKKPLAVPPKNASKTKSDKITETPKIDLSVIAAFYNMPPLIKPIEENLQNEPRQDDNSKTLKVDLTTIENFYKVPAPISPIKLTLYLEPYRTRQPVKSIKVEVPFESFSSSLVIEPFKPIVDSTMQDMIDIFAKNIESLAKSVGITTEPEEIESFVGRKRKMNSSTAPGKRQKC